MCKGWIYTPPEVYEERKKLENEERLKETFISKERMIL